MLCTLGTLTRVTFITVVVVAVACDCRTDVLAGPPPRRPTGRRTAGDQERSGDPGGVLAGAGGSCSSTSTVRRHHGQLGRLPPRVRPGTDLAPGAEPGPIAYLLHPQTWWTQFLQLVAPVPSLSDGRLRYVLMTVVLLVVLGLAVVTAVRRRGAATVDRPGAVAILLLAVVFAGSMAKLAVHVSHRGGANQRYLLDALGLWAVGGALLVVGLARLAPHAVALVGALGATGTVLYAAGIVARTDDSVGASTFGDLRASLSDSIVPGAGLICVVALLMAVAGLAAAVSSVGRRCARPAVRSGGVIS